MSDDELFYLEKIGDSASSTMESIRASLSGRINSFILVVSFVVLAESTITAALVPQAFNNSIDPLFRCIGFLMVLGAFALLGCASYQIYKVFHVNLSVALFPEDPELPFLRSEIVKRDVTSFSESEEAALFQTPIFKQSPKYADVKLLYRRWVFQQVKALHSQYERADELKGIFNKTAILVISNVVLLVFGATTLALGSM